MSLVEPVITAVAVLSVLFFFIYVAGILRLPTGNRPKTPVFNRFGDPMPPRQNPGYAETEDEHEAGGG
jgi:hypothetical protein